jgi:hypothetical protein
VNNENAPDSHRKQIYPVDVPGGASPSVQIAGKSNTGTAFNYNSQDSAVTSSLTRSRLIFDAN